MIANTNTNLHIATQPASDCELGDLLVSYLKQLSVDYVFGVPGGAIEPLYNALAHSALREGPRPVVARHETGAAFMADGYARETGRLGVCCATTGPGATNLITGVYSAYQNHIPMLVITAQTSLSNFGRGAFQESSCTGINTVGMFEYCTRYNTLVSHVDQFERKLAAAIICAFQLPTGPVHLSIPLDVLRSPAPHQGLSYNLAELVSHSAFLDDIAVDEFCRLVANANKVVFVIGEGCSEVIGTILELAMLINARVVTTPDGKGLVSSYHPLFRGVIGFAGHKSASEALTDPEVDIVVAAGTKLGEWDSNAWDIHALLNKRLVHVDSAEDHLTHSPMARLHVRGRIATIFEHVLDYTKGNRVKSNDSLDLDSVGVVYSSLSAEVEQELRCYFHMDDEAKYYDNSIPIKPQRLMRELPRLLPPNTRFFADTGNSMAWAIHYLYPFDRRIAGKRDAHGGTIRTCTEFASMGWGIGAAIGSALGCRDNLVVCITGDGSLLMSGQEITVAIQEKLPMIFVILNDSGLGMVKHGQRLAGAEEIGFELPDIDYAVMAKAMGAAGHIIRSPQDLLDLDIDAMCQRLGPTLLDVRVDAEEVPPMQTRMWVLGAVK